MKKVLFVATVTKHINTFHIPYLELFKEKGYEVHVASRGNEKIKYCDKHFDLPFERFPLKKNNIKTYKELKKIINENNYEIIHCHTPVGGVLTRLAARKARKKGTRVIYTAHGFHFYKGAPLLNWLIYYPIEKICSRWTDTLITINSEDYEFAKKKFKKCKDIQLVHGVGLDTSRFDKELTEHEKMEKRKELGINKDDIVFSYVAELNKNKNQILLINTIKELKKEMTNVKLLLVGQGPLYEEYQNIIKKNNLKENIKLLGRRKDINEILSITDIYLASSLREGLPVNIMEAMYKGVPIIAKDNRGHKELIKDSENGFIIKDIDEMKQKIKQLLMRKLSNNFFQKNKEFIQKYLLEKIIENMNKIYTNLCKIKVVHILSSNSYSGAESVAIQIIQKTNYTDYIEHIYVSPDGKIRKTLENKNIIFLPIKKVRIKEIRKILKQVNPNIIHAHDFRASISTAFSNYKVYKISHIHKNDPRMKKINIYSLLYLFSCFKYNKILMVSNEIKNEFIFNRFIKSKVNVIGNPIDIKTVKEKAEDKIDSEDYDVLYVGRLSEEKKPLEFIQIINEIKKLIPNIKCGIIGDGVQKGECVQMIKKSNLEKNVHLLGFLDNPYPVIKNSKILCITSIWEGFGLVAVESLSLGVPVIARNVGGLKEILDSSCGYLVNSKEEYICSINQLLTNEDLRKEKSINAKNKSYKIDNIKMYMENIIKIYKEKNA